MTLDISLAIQAVKSKLIFVTVIGGAANYNNNVSTSEAILVYSTFVCRGWLAIGWQLL